MSYDSWKTTDPRECKWTGHAEACVCEKCHLFHVTYRLTKSYVHDPFYTCCREEVDKWIKKGEWCPNNDDHGGGDMLIDGRCNLCVEEEQKHRKGAA